MTRKKSSPPHSVLHLLLSRSRQGHRPRGRATPCQGLPQGAQCRQLLPQPELLGRVL